MAPSASRSLPEGEQDDLRVRRQPVDGSMRIVDRRGSSATAVRARRRSAASSSSSPRSASTASRRSRQAAVRSCDVGPLVVDVLAELGQLGIGVEGGDRGRRPGSRCGHRAKPTTGGRVACGAGQPSWVAIGPAMAAGALGPARPSQPTLGRAVGPIGLAEQGEEAALGPRRPTRASTPRVASRRMRTGTSAARRRPRDGRPRRGWRGRGRAVPRPGWDSITTNVRPGRPVPE